MGAICVRRGRPKTKLGGRIRGRGFFSSDDTHYLQASKLLFIFKALVRFVGLS